MAVYEEALASNFLRNHERVKTIEPARCPSYSMWPGSQFATELEVKTAAMALQTVRPDATGVAIDDTLHGCQADAGTDEFILVVQALEGPEQLVRIGHIETYAVIAYVEAAFAMLQFGPYANVGNSFLGCELPRVADKILHHYL